MRSFYNSVIGYSPFFEHIGYFAFKPAGPAFCLTGIVFVQIPVEPSYTVKYILVAYLVIPCVYKCLKVFKVGRIGKLKVVLKIKAKLYFTVFGKLLSNLRQITFGVKAFIQQIKIKALRRLHKIISVAVNPLNVIAAERVGNCLCGNDSGTIVKQVKILINQLTRNHRPYRITNNHFVAVVITLDILKCVGKRTIAGVTALGKINLVVTCKHGKIAFVCLNVCNNQNLINLFCLQNCINNIFNYHFAVNFMELLWHIGAEASADTACKNCNNVHNLSFNFLNKLFEEGYLWLCRICKHGINNPL